MPRNELKYLLAEFLDNLCCLCNPLVWSRYRRKRSHRLELMSLNLHSPMQNVHLPTQNVHFPTQNVHLPTQNLLSDAECKICKYKSLIISVYSSNYGGQILCRGTEEGRKIYKNLQMKLPSKIKYTNICKDVFPVLCIFTFVNTDFCTFLYSLWSEWSATSNFCPFRYIYLCSSLYIFVIWRKMGAFYNSKLAC